MHFLPIQQYDKICLHKCETKHIHAESKHNNLLDVARMWNYIYTLQTISQQQTPETFLLLRKRETARLGIPTHSTRW